MRVRVHKVREREVHCLLAVDLAADLRFFQPSHIQTSLQCGLSEQGRVGWLSTLLYPSPPAQKEDFFAWSTLERKQAAASTTKRTVESRQQERFEVDHAQRCRTRTCLHRGR